MQSRTTGILVFLGLLAMSGCSTIRGIESNLEVMSGNTGVMAHHMGIVANNMHRMVGVAERLEKNINARVDAFSAASPKIEPYLEKFAETDRMMVKNLNGIRGELAEIRKIMGSPGDTVEPRGEAPTNRELLSSLQRLEKQLEVLSWKAGREDGRPH